MNKCNNRAWCTTNLTIWHIANCHSPIKKKKLSHPQLYENKGNVNNDANVQLANDRLTCNIM